MGEEQEEAAVALPKMDGVARGIQRPRHLVLEATATAVANGKTTEEDAEQIVWLYDWAKERRLNYEETGKKCGLGTATVYGLMHGNYGAASWDGAVKAIRRWREIAEEESKKKNIGFVETDTAKTIWNACRAAMNDGMPAFIYGASQMGKTTALLAFREENNHGRTRYLRLGSRWTKTRLVRELAKELGNGMKGKTVWELEDAIFAGLNRRNLLIIDEFHLAVETSDEASAKAIVEFIREVYDRTGCGLVISATKLGMTGLEDGRNKMLFDQLKRRGTVKVVLPDVPKVKDINCFARAFELPQPSGEVLGGIKGLLKTRGLGVFVKYLQKAFAISQERGEDLTWERYTAVARAYASLAEGRNEY